MGCNNSKSADGVKQQSVEAKPEDAPVVQRYYTASTVALHPSVDKSPLRQVWTIISGIVYRVDTFAADHPGGEDLLLQSAGGQDSTLFYAHDSTPERPFAHLHGRAAATILEKLKIGTLVEEGDPRAGRSEEEVAAEAAPVAATDA